MHESARDGALLTVETVRNGETISGFATFLDEDWIGLFYPLDFPRLISIQHIVSIYASDPGMLERLKELRDTNELVRRTESIRRAANQYLTDYKGGPNGTL